MSNAQLPSHLNDIPAEDHELAHHLLNLRQAPSADLRRTVQAIPRPGQTGSYWLPNLSWGVSILLVLALLFVLA